MRLHAMLIQRPNDVRIESPLRTPVERTRPSSSWSSAKVSAKCHLRYFSVGPLASSARGRATGPAFSHSHLSMLNRMAVPSGRPRRLEAAVPMVLKWAWSSLRRSCATVMSRASWAVMGHEVGTGVGTAAAASDILDVLHLQGRLDGGKGRVDSTHGADEPRAYLLAGDCGRDSRRVSRFERREHGAGALDVAGRLRHEEHDAALDRRLSHGAEARGLHEGAPPPVDGAGPLEERQG